MARDKAKKKSWLPTIVAVLAVFSIFGVSSDKDKDKSTVPEDPPKVEETVDKSAEGLDAEPEIGSAPAEDSAATELTPVETAQTETTPASEPEPEPAPETTPAPVVTEAPKSRTVYVTKTGKRYHYDSHCNGATYYESDLDSATRQGLTPCKKCVG